MSISQGSMSVAISELDDQNKQIVNCGNAIVKGLMLGEPTEALLHRFDTLIELLEIQFGREGLLADKGVLHFNKLHHQDHIKILDEAHRLRNSIHDGVPSTPFADFVRSLSQHIDKYDMQYKILHQTKNTESLMSFVSVK